MEKLTKNELINYFTSGEKNPENIFIGTEHEKFIFNLKTKKPVEYSEKGVLGIFEILKKNGWNDIREKNNLIGLKKDDHSITLEPGLQIELSGSPQKNIHETCKEVNLYLKELKEACSKLNFGIIGIGFVPNVKFEEVHHLPKKRYEIMRNYMPKVGSLGLEMMHRTAATQVNFDYLSEEDFKIKTKVASCLTPIAISLFSYSPITENKINGYLNYRTHIWQNTDKDRSGLLPFFFETSNSYEQYCDYALDVPMYFAVQDGETIDCSGKSFKDFLNGNLKEVGGRTANIDDWNNHLSTIFTEIRLKKYLEIRCADSCSWSGICSIPAFWTGILYSEKVLKEIFDYVKNWEFLEVQQAYLQASKTGFKTELYGKSLLEHAKFILSLSSKGLEERNYLNSNNDNESIFLKDLFDMTDKGKNLSDLLIEDFDLKYNKDTNKIFDEKAF